MRRALPKIHQIHRMIARLIVRTLLVNRHDDGSAGDANYGRIGQGYTAYRKPDPAIASFIEKAFGDVDTVLNVGAGAGSYEPLHRHVTAVEPSASMREQRAAHLSKAIDARAEALPFESDFFDASMATFSVHQWSDLEGGLAEMRRVTKGPVLILTCDPAVLRDTWLFEYAPEMIDVEVRRYPSVDRISSALGSNVSVLPVPIPLNCTDGFSEAYYGRPECLLDPGARRANSAWSFVDAAAEARFAHKLDADLKAGVWDQKHGALRNLPFFEGSLRLVVGRVQDDR
jgi:SAM-dependent methyltransferase